MNLPLVKKYLTPNSILDIGANIGQFYLAAKQTFPNAFIFSVEGNILCEKHLSKNNPNYLIRLLDSEIRYRHLWLNRSACLSTGSSYYKELSEHFDFDNAKSFAIKTDTLDDTFPYQNFDLIKLDTQGSELDILKGGINLVQRSKAIILEVSHQPYNQDAPLTHEVIEYMTDINFLLKETLDTNAAPKQQLAHGKTFQSDYLFLNEWWYNYYEQLIQK